SSARQELPTVRARDCRDRTGAECGDDVQLQIERVEPVCTRLPAGLAPFEPTDCEGFERLRCLRREQAQIAERQSLADAPRNFVRGRAVADLLCASPARMVDEHPPPRPTGLVRGGIR